MLRKRSEELLWENDFSTRLFGFCTFVKVDLICYDKQELSLLIVIQEVHLNLKIKIS
jgi:hypothetical protein